ncbi:MAG: hypothetical protein ACLGGU_06985 [Gammaproteobacteria bacterium]
MSGQAARAATALTGCAPSSKPQAMLLGVEP